jgi:hypothetical protein
MLRDCRHAMGWLGAMALLAFPVAGCGESHAAPGGPEIPDATTPANGGGIDAGAEGRADATAERDAMIEGDVGALEDRAPAAPDIGDGALPPPDGAMAVPSGILDTSFAGTGYVTRTGTGGTATPRTDWGNGVVIDSSGRIVVAGRSINSSFYVAAAWRITPDGAFDTTFGGDGSWSSATQVDGGDLSVRVHRARLVITRHSPRG